MVQEREFREVLGHFPTGVVVVTALGPDRGPVGMAVGSFSSVSIEPPLVGFYPAVTSTTWPRIEQAGSFCVNVLGAEQEAVCRIFATSGGDKFREIGWRGAGSGAPLLDGVLAWIDCDLESVTAAGDHHLVLGRVRELGIERSASPLLFFRGGYGRLVPRSLAAAAGDLAAHLPVVDLARPEMERLAAALGTECVATGVTGDELVFLASAGRPRGDATPTWVGRRVPFAPPIAAVLLAWADASATAAWVTGLADQATGDILELLASVRRRGYSVGLRHQTHESLTTSVALLAETPEDAQLRAQARRQVEGLGTRFELTDPAPGGVYDVGRISAPVFDAAGRAVLALNLHGLPPAASAEQVQAWAGALVDGADLVTAALGGRPPA